MKKAILVGVVMVCALAGVLSLRAQEPEKKIPTGMEEVEVGGVKMVIPTGMKMTTEGAHTTMEDTNIYLARRLSEMEARIRKIEALVAKAGKGTKRHDSLVDQRIANIELAIKKINAVIHPEKE